MKKVLIIEDNKEQAKKISNYFYAITSDLALERAYSFDEALSKIQNGTYDIITIDLNLSSRKNGVDLISSINSVKTTKKPWIIVISGYVNLKLEVYDNYDILKFLSKPLNFSEFKRLVEGILDYTIERVKCYDIVVKKKFVTYKFNLDEILYFEVLNRNLIVYTRDQKVINLGRYTLREMTHLVSETGYKDFFQVYRSISANKNYFDRIVSSKSGKFIRLHNCDTLLPISKMRLTEIKSLM